MLESVSIFTYCLIRTRYNSAGVCQLCGRKSSKLDGNQMIISQSMINNWWSARHSLCINCMGLCKRALYADAINN